eukprot:1154265-Pelagomonas_calceolata.AAC.3
MAPWAQAPILRSPAPTQVQQRIHTLEMYKGKMCEDPLFQRFLWCGSLLCTVYLRLRYKKRKCRGTKVTHCSLPYLGCRSRHVITASANMIWAVQRGLFPARKKKFCFSAKSQRGNASGRVVGGMLCGCF